MASVAEVLTIRKARMADIPAIKAMIDSEVRSGGLLSRTLSELYENVRDFHTCDDGQRLGGCCALHVDLPDLAEVRSLVVRADLRGRFVGARLIEASIEEARQLGLPQVYALTRACTFFERHGFRRVDKAALPHKVYRDCLRCDLYPDCDEVAMIRDIES